MFCPLASSPRLSTLRADRSFCRPTGAPGPPGCGLAIPPAGTAPRSAFQACLPEGNYILDKYGVLVEPFNQLGAIARGAFSGRSTVGCQPFANASSISRCNSLVVTDPALHCVVNSMHMISRSIGILALIVTCSFTGAQMSIADQLNDVPVAAPIDTDSAGRGGDIATHAVVRVICTDNNLGGTGFLHKSGNILTANHVVHNCGKLLLILPNSTRVDATILASDLDHDLAVLKPATPIAASPLQISTNNDFKVGAQVSTWGFPAGYFGLSPMLSVGYLAGIDAAQLPGGKIVRQWVVNAAFNGGNSGGPLIHIETGSVFGVVSSKLAPISPEAASILQALEQNVGTGVIYSGKSPDGKDIKATEGQLVGKVLNELRQQVQLVIGKAVLIEDIKAFLTANKIEP